MPMIFSPEFWTWSWWQTMAPMLGNSTTQFLYRWWKMHRNICKILGMHSFENFKIIQLINEMQLIILFTYIYMIYSTAFNTCVENLIGIKVPVHARYKGRKLSVVRFYNVLKTSKDIYLQTSQHLNIFIYTHTCTYSILDILKLGSYNKLIISLNMSSLNVIFFRKQIQEINWRRKSEQTEAGNKLKDLEDRYMYMYTLYYYQ